MFPIELLKKKACIELLEFFISEPDSEFYQTQITERANLSRATVLKSLETLAESEFLTARKEGVLKRYKLNSENPVVKQTKILLAVAKLYEAAKILKGAEVYLYGSAARGEDKKESDIDILIIGKAERKSLIEFAEKAKKLTSKNVNPIVMTPLEYSNLIRKDRLFYENAEKNKIRLV